MKPSSCCVFSALLLVAVPIRAQQEDMVIINTASPQAHVDVGSVEVVKDPNSK